MFFLSGLPRTGSTLLSSILSQNPKIHSEGNSAVCQLMWDMKESCDKKSMEQLMGSNRLQTKNELISSIPKIYYSDVKKENVIDKCRSWTIPENLEMIKEYITKNPKIIVMTRPIEDIVASFVNLRKINGWTGDLKSDLLENSEPIMRSLYGLNYAKENNSGEFIFVDYDDLVSDTEGVLKQIYNFFDLDFFAHNLNEIINENPENDEVHGLSGMHDVRKNIEKRYY
jgi:sulfotransferase